MPPLLGMQRLRAENGPSLPLGEQLRGLLQPEVLLLVSGLRIPLLHVCHAVHAQVFHRLLVSRGCHELL